jgi:hypothetical protein
MKNNDSDNFKQEELKSIHLLIMLKTKLEIKKYYRNFKKWFKNIFYIVYIQEMNLLNQSIKSFCSTSQQLGQLLKKMKEIKQLF